jgi:hypothetical protein
MNTGPAPAAAAIFEALPSGWPSSTIAHRRWCAPSSSVTDTSGLDDAMSASRAAAVPAASSYSPTTGEVLTPVARSSRYRSSLGPDIVRSWGRTPDPRPKGSIRSRPKNPRWVRSTAVLGLISPLVVRQVEAHGVAGMAVQQRPLELRADHVIWRSDEGADVADDVGVVPERAKGADVGHGILWSAATRAGTGVRERTRGHRIVR